MARPVIVLLDSGLSCSVLSLVLKWTRSGKLTQSTCLESGASISLEVKVEATNSVGYLTLSWPVQVSKVDPVTVSGSCVTSEAEGDLQGGSREAGTSGKVPASQGVTEAGSQGALCLEVDQVRKVALCLVLTCAVLS